MWCSKNAGAFTHTEINAETDTHRHNIIWCMSYRDCQIKTCAGVWLAVCVAEVCGGRGEKRSSEAAFGCPAVEPNKLSPPPSLLPPPPTTESFALVLVELNMPYSSPPSAVWRDAWMEGHVSYIHAQQNILSSCSVYYTLPPTAHFTLHNIHITQ